MSKRRNFYSGVQGESSARCSSGELTLADLAGKYGVHTTQITSWKRQAKEGMVSGICQKSADETKVADCRLTWCPNLTTYLRLRLSCSGSGVLRQCEFVIAGWFLRE